MKFDIKTRTEQLMGAFGSFKEKPWVCSDPLVDIFRYQFTQTKGSDEIAHLQNLLPEFEYPHTEDGSVTENKSFTYNVFVPKGVTKSSKAIVLLHGLNERSWSKYLSWAEQLAVTTAEPVILFPIAFHMNRTPISWYNPRCTSGWLAQREKKLSNLSNCTFANVTLSSRISESPLRFYISGKETCYNLWQLFSQIKEGGHPLFEAGTTINLFGYSIGAMLAQVMMLANPDGLLTDSRVFIFMGGSIFIKMNGNARDIMDRTTLETLQNFYTEEFVEKGRKRYLFGDRFEEAFILLMQPDMFRTEREERFRMLDGRVYAVTMKKDVVMPTEGVIDAFGTDNSRTMVEELDFPFEYSHQNPFPLTGKVSSEAVRSAFDSIFSRAGRFFTDTMRPAVK